MPNELIDKKQTNNLNRAFFIWVVTLIFFIFLLLLQEVTSLKHLDFYSFYF